MSVTLRASVNAANTAGLVGGCIDMWADIKHEAWTRWGNKSKWVTLNCSFLFSLAKLEQVHENTIFIHPPSSRSRAAWKASAPSARVTGASVHCRISSPRTCTLPDLGVSLLRRVTFFPALRLLSWSQYACCSWSYYRYAPAKCKTSICHLSAHRLSSVETSHNAAPLPWTYHVGLILLLWEEVCKVSPAATVCAIFKTVKILSSIVPRLNFCIFLMRMWKIQGIT